MAAPVAFGQAKAKAGGGRAAGAARSQSSSASGGGLDSLSDDALLSELAGRQMQGLLNYAFDRNKVPEKQRAAMLALPAIRRLSDADNPPKPHERAMLIKQIGDGAQA